MLGGVITSHGRTPLVVVDGNLKEVCYRDEIIQRHVIPLIQTRQLHITLQQDNTRPHVARVVMDFFAQQNADVLLCPAVMKWRYV